MSGFGLAESSVEASSVSDSPDPGHAVTEFTLLRMHSQKFRV